MSGGWVPVAVRQAFNDRAPTTTERVVEQAPSVLSQKLTQNLIGPRRPSLSPPP